MLEAFSALIASTPGCGSLAIITTGRLPRTLSTSCSGIAADPRTAMPSTRLASARSALRRSSRPAAWSSSTLWPSSAARASNPIRSSEK